MNNHIFLTQTGRAVLLRQKFLGLQSCLKFFFLFLLVNFSIFGGDGCWAATHRAADRDFHNKANSPQSTQRKRGGQRLTESHFKMGTGRKGKSESARKSETSKFWCKLQQSRPVVGWKQQRGVQHFDASASVDQEKEKESNKEREQILIAALDSLDKEK